MCGSLYLRVSHAAVPILAMCCWWHIQTDNNLHKSGGCPSIGSSRSSAVFMIIVFPSFCVCYYGFPRQCAVISPSKSSSVVIPSSWLRSVQPILNLL